MATHVLRSVVYCVSWIGLNRQDNKFPNRTWGRHSFYYGLIHAIVLIVIFIFDSIFSSIRDWLKMKHIFIGRNLVREQLQLHVFYTHTHI